MYQQIYYDREENRIHLWDDETGYESFEYEPYAYVIAEDGEFTTLDGFKCNKVTSWEESAENMGLIYENDVQPTTRVLIDRYSDSDDLSKNVKTFFFDIEVEKDETYSDPWEAENRITSIAYYCTGDKHYRCLLLDEHRGDGVYETNITVGEGENTKVVKAAVKTFKHEKELIKFFLKQWRKSNFQIVTGWNIDGFDLPYLYTRIINVLGKDFVEWLSPIGLLKKRFTSDEFTSFTVSIGGISTLDYLDLYKKFTYTEQPNYKLDTISEIELGRKKIEYDGDLQKLYETDIVKFAEYNIIDVELIVAMEEKLDFIDIARGICHKGHVLYDDIQYTSRYLDGAALTYCRRNGIIATGKNQMRKETAAEGAYVKVPIPGLYSWVYDLDLTSLYPMNIITLNISPETKVGIFAKWDEEEYVKNVDRRYRFDYKQDAFKDIADAFAHIESPAYIEFNNPAEVKSWLEEKNYSVASNGAVYDMNKKGLIPAILSMWFDERAEYKRIRKEKELAGDHESGAYYDKKQLVTKILLNSFYGVLLLKSFRFYDKQNGEGVTLTGQSVIKWSSKVADAYYNRELGTNKEWCIYTDTDSIFYPAAPLIEKWYGEGLSDEKMTEYSLEVASKVQSYIDASYTPYAKRYHNVDSHRWEIKQELIARRAIWLGQKDKKTGQLYGVKKRYAQWIVNKEGVPVNKMDVKGLDVVRSNFPKSFRKFTSDVLKDILHDVSKDDLNAKVRQFRKDMKQGDIFEIMLPTGAKNVKNYETGTINNYIKGTPAHIKAVLNYNSMLDVLNIKSIPKISNGEKIIWGYLVNNPYYFESMALTYGENPQEILEYVEKYLNRDKIFTNTLTSKLQTYWDSLSWGNIILNDTANNFFI